MTWLFLQTWLWHLVAFLLGALITWLIFAKPWKRQHGAHEATDTAPERELAAARARVSTLETDLAACRKARAEEADANERQVAGLRAKLDAATAPVPAGTLLGAETANEDITATSDLTAARQRLAAADAKAAADAAAADAGTGNGSGAGTATAAGAAGTGTAPTGSTATGAAAGAATADADADADAAEDSDTATDTVAGAAIGASAGAGAAKAGGDKAGEPAKPMGLVGGAAAGPYGPGSAKSLPDGSAPEGFTIKGNADSGLFHTKESPWYGRTKAEAWFDTEDSAKAAGFTSWRDRNQRKK